MGSKASTIKYPLEMFALDFLGLQSLQHSPDLGSNGGWRQHCPDVPEWQVPWHLDFRCVGGCIEDHTFTLGRCVFAAVLLES